MYYSISSEDRLTWGEKHGFDFEIELGLNAFRKYIKENEILLDRISKELQLKISKTTNKQDAEYEDQFLEYEADLIKEMKQTHRFAIFMGIVAFYEGTLLQICETIEPQVPTKTKLTYIRAKNDFQKYLVYILNKLNIDLAGDLAQLYKVLKDKRELRHKIAHQKGKIDKPHILLIIQQYKGISPIGDGQSFIIKEVGFLNELLDEVEAFYSELLKEIDKKISNK